MPPACASVRRRLPPSAPQLSATAFTVLGNACKILSVLINVVIWDKHASPSGLLFLALTLAYAHALRTACPARARRLVL